jgi:hypothetical protein
VLPEAQVAKQAPKLPLPACLVLPRGQESHRIMLFEAPVGNHGWNARCLQALFS